MVFSKKRGAEYCAYKPPQTFSEFEPMLFIFVHISRFHDTFYVTLYLVKLTNPHVIRLFSLTKESGKVIMLFVIDIPFRLRIKRSSGMSELCFFTKNQSKRYKTCSDAYFTFIINTILFTFQYICKRKYVFPISSSQNRACSSPFHYYFLLSANFGEE